LQVLKFEAIWLWIGSSMRSSLSKRASRLLFLSVIPSGGGAAHRDQDGSANPVENSMENIFAAIRPRKRYPMVVRYGLTAMIVGVAFMLRLSLHEPLRAYPLLLFIPAIFLAALLFDKGSGLFATILSTLLAEYFFIPPLHSFTVDAEHVLPLLLFTGIGAVISVGTETLLQTIDKLAQSEKEKTLLLEELAHRTKNDLMLISSVLTLQARSMSDAVGRAALESAIARVAVIIKAQEKLDGSKRSGTVEAGAYLEALCSDLGNLLRDVRPIAVSVEAERIELMSSQAVSIGLIANELVTNAFKYAFPGERGGTVKVCLRRENENVILAVTDDGIGRSPRASAGQGSSLVLLLAEQWGGQLEYESPGTGCRVRVQLPLHRKPSSTQLG
jgi:two-component sensor histidine kinase